MSEPTAKTPCRVLLLFPGLGCDDKMWRCQIDAFEAEGWRVYVADLKRDDSLTGMALRALAQIDAAEGLETRFCIGGFSMGGYAALTLILDHAERVEKAVILSSATTKPTPDAPSKDHPSFQLLDSGRPEEEIMSIFLQGAMKKLPLYTHLPNPEHDKTLLDGIRDTGVEGLKKQYIAMTSPPDLKKRLGEIRVPTLLMWSQDDKLVPPARSEEMAELIPGVQTKIVREASHFIPFEKPVEVTAAMRDFFTGKGEFAGS
jgi:pimeloyl-ACP methyl ester carboxylesterase